METPYTYVESFIPDHAEWFARLRDELSWVQRDGTPRQEYWANHFDRSYTYGSGKGIRTYEAQPTLELIDAGRELLGGYAVLLQGCFLNKYLTSRDHLGWHSDDELMRELIKQGLATIAASGERSLAEQLSARLCSQPKRT